VQRTSLTNGWTLHDDMEVLVNKIWKIFPDPIGWLQHLYTFDAIFQLEKLQGIVLISMLTYQRLHQQ
jgi:hypothetical protein